MKYVASFALLPLCMLLLASCADSAPSSMDHARTVGDADQLMTLLRRLAPVKGRLNVEMRRNNPTAPMEGERHHEHPERQTDAEPAFHLNEAERSGHPNVLDVRSKPGMDEHARDKPGRDVDTRGKPGQGKHDREQFTRDKPGRDGSNRGKPTREGGRELGEPAVEKRTPEVRISMEQLQRLQRGREGGEGRGPHILQLRADLPSSCTSEYAAMPASTMCDFFDNPQATNPGVSDPDIKEILDYHNKKRGDVTPTATNMQKMYWDDNIAKIAQKYAVVCPDWHDTSEQRAVPDWNVLVGQNLAWGSNTWTEAMEAWHEEGELYIFGVAADPATLLQNGNMIGHYTQLVNHHSARIGCGFASCPTGDPYWPMWNTYVCNYAEGQWLDEFQYPYTDGASTADCPQSKSGNLCDCGGIVCVNGGTLNVNTCVCECTAIYTGDDCSAVDCPAEDAWYCGTDWPPSDCKLYYNVPWECPYMCGLCPS